MTDSYFKTAKRVSVLNLIFNLALSAAKFTAGALSGSGALVSDGVNSLSDVFSSAVVLIGVKISSKKADREHPYGHERLECIAAFVLSAMLCATALMIAFDGVKNIIAIANGEYELKSDFLPLALSAAIFSIALKFIMYLYTERGARRINSSALHGDAMNHLSDSLSSFGSLIAIICGMCGLAVFDPIASLIICLFILKAAYDICFTAVNQLVDRAADERVEESMKKIAASCDGVKKVDVLRTRIYGSKIFVEAEIAVDADMPLLAAHKIAESVHERIEREFPCVKHCMVHVNPWINGVEPDNHEAPENEWQ